VFGNFLLLNLVLVVLVESFGSVYRSAQVSAIVPVRVVR
jgi:hypothetical protein